MRLPYRPHADYLAPPFTPDPGGPYGPVTPRFSEAEYEKAITITRRSKPRKGAPWDPEVTKAMIVGFFRIAEDVLRYLDDPANAALLDRNCIVDPEDMEVVTTNPLSTTAHWLSFYKPRVTDAHHTWTTTDPTICVEAVNRWRGTYPEIFGTTLRGYFCLHLRRTNDLITELQRRFEEIAMREWKSQQIRNGDDAQPTRGYIITCGDCGATDTFKNTKFGEEVACEVVPKHFKQKGWIVNNKREGFDRCPACQQKIALARKAERGLPVPPGPEEAAVEIIPPEKPLKALGDLKKVVSIRPRQQPPVKPAEAVMTTPVSTPTRAQNRLIQDALAKVYPVAEQGYAKGASDHTVATALALPVDWIRQHREQFFGPAERIDLSTTEQRIAALKNRMTDLEEKGLKQVADLKAQVEAREKAALAEIATMKRLVKEAEDKVLADIDALREETEDLGKEMDGIRQRLGDVA